jgi:hypothetical protein
MADLRFNKKVFNNRDYKRVIDTSFTQLGVKTVQEQVDEQPTVGDFFKMYNELFYQINELGATDSHEYLIKTSGEYVSFEGDNKIIKSLQKEIAGLREELLELKLAQTTKSL